MLTYSLCAISSETAQRMVAKFFLQTRAICVQALGGVLCR